MCHLIFLLPLTGLPLFWFLPLDYALPVNAGIGLLSAFLYWLIKRAMMKPVEDGFRSLIGTEAKVVTKLDDGSSRYLVRCHGELWSAHSTDALEAGESVKIVAVKGISVMVKRIEQA